MVLKKLIFNSFYFGEGVVVLKNLFLTVSTLRGCGGLDRTDGNSFYIGRVWWYLKVLNFNSFWCGGLERN